MSRLTRPLSRREWLAAYTISITGSIAVAAITVLLVDANLAREANPVTHALAGSSSWGVVLAFKFAVIVPAFQGYRLLADRWHPSVGRAGAWSFAGIVSLNFLNDFGVFLSVGPVFSLTPLLELVPIALVGVAVAAVATLGPLDTLRSAARKTSRRQVGFAIVFVGFMIAAPSVPFFGLSSTSPIGTASAATAKWEHSYSTTFDDQTTFNNDWEQDSGTGSFSWSNNEGYDDQYSLYLDAGTQDNVWVAHTESKGVVGEGTNIDASFNARYYNDGGVMLIFQITDGYQTLDVQLDDTWVRIKGTMVDDLQDTNVNGIGGSWKDFGVRTNETHAVLESGNAEVVTTLTGETFNASDTRLRIYGRDSSSTGSSTYRVDNISTRGGGQIQSVSGTVKDSNGEPCSKCTVEVVAVDGNKITPKSGQTKQERAEELLEDASNPLPDSWDSDLDLAGPDGHFESAESEYVAIHDPEPWGLETWSTGIGDLSRPKLNPAAEEELILSVWNPSKTGTGDQLSPVNRQLPGATVNRDVVIQRLDHKGDVVDTRKVSLDKKRSVGVAGLSAYEHPYERVSLPEGVYRIHPEGASNTAYTIVVGNENDLREAFASDLRDQADALSKAANDFQSKINDGTFTRKVATTDSNGKYSVDVSASTESVAVSAYKIDGETLTSMSNPSPQDMRAWVVNNDYNGSVYFSVEPRKYGVPESNADVTVRKFNSPPFALLDDWVSKWDEWRDMLENETRTDLGTLYNVNLDDWNESQLETGAEDLSTLLEQVEDGGDTTVIHRWEERTGEDWETFKEELAESRRTEEQLREDVRALEETIESLQSELEGENSEWEYGDNTVTYRQAFDGDFTEDDVVAVWKDHDGSTTTIPDEYITVQKRAGRGDVVAVENYPIHESSTGGYISVTVASEDGKIGRGGGPVENPAFDGEVPEIRSIDVSTLKPGEGERVTVEPKVETGGVTLESVDVYDGNGQTISSSVASGKANFTAGSGTHFVRMTFNDSDGNQFVETMRVPVGDDSFEYPASVAVREGRLGTYALAGDEVNDARVKIGSSGKDVDVTALVDDGSSTSEVHVYLEDAPSTSKQSVTMRVIEGDSIDTGTSLSKRVGLFVHGRELADDTLVYRTGSAVEGGRQPIPAGSSTKGGERTDGDDGDGTVIKTYTGKNGETTISTNTDPGLGERIRWRFDVFVATTNLPIVMSVPTPTTVDVPTDVDPLGAITGIVDGLDLDLALELADQGGAIHDSISPVVGVEA